MLSDLISGDFRLSVGPKDIPEAGTGHQMVLAKYDKGIFLPDFGTSLKTSLGVS